jgi:hypothetical protein
MRVTRTLLEVLPPEREGHFQTRVVKLARVFGWRVYHPWLSIHSGSGWPDLFLVRKGHAVAAELKTARGHVRSSQQDWIDELNAVCGIQAYTWRPADWDQIVAVLR